MLLAAPLVLAVLASAPGGSAGAASRPGGAGRTAQAPFEVQGPGLLKDLQGTWIARDYLERLRNLRAPHATARQAAGIAIKIEQEGATWPILITNFQKAILNFVIDVQPDAKPGSYRLAVAKEDRAGLSLS